MIVIASLGSLTMSPPAVPKSITQHSTRGLGEKIMGIFAGKRHQYFEMQVTEVCVIVRLLSADRLK